jgi:LytS/YehU family sensor histidine kinase
MGSVRHGFFICINQTGTATSSPTDTTASQSDMNITNTMLWMKKEAYEDTTIRKVAKLLRHLKKNCDTTNPEKVKAYIAGKNCGNGHKENLSKPMQSTCAQKTKHGISPSTNATTRNDEHQKRNI